MIFFFFFSAVHSRSVELQNGSEGNEKKYNMWNKTRTCSSSVLLRWPMPQDLAEFCGGQASTFHTSFSSGQRWRSLDKQRSRTWSGSSSVRTTGICSANNPEKHFWYNTYQTICTQRINMRQTDPWKILTKKMSEQNEKKAGFELTVDQWQLSGQRRPFPALDG